MLACFDKISVFEFKQFIFKMKSLVLKAVLVIISVIAEIS